MTTQLTKTDIEFDEFRIWRVVEIDPETREETVVWYASVGYRVTTAEREVWTRDLIEEIKGPIKTKAADLLKDIRNHILQKEGLA